MIKESIGGATRYESRNASDSVKVVAGEFGGWEALKKSILDPENAFQGNVATRFGEQHEDAACESAKVHLGYPNASPQQRYVRTIKGIQYACTTDLFDKSDSVIIEVKCPYQGKQSKIWRSVVDRGDPSYYYWQIQHQLLVTGAKSAYLFIYDPTDGAYSYVEIDSHEQHQRHLMDRWDAFYQWLETDTPDPNDGYTLRVDDEWELLARRFKDLKKEAETVNEQLESVKKELIELATSDKTKGSGVSVIKSDRVGNVNYKAIPELKGVDLDLYRGKSIEVWTVSLTKEQK